MHVGIDAVSISVPKLYLHYEELAKARNIDPAKLKHGIGVEKMAVPDADEDVATLAADACLRLLGSSGVKPGDIGRLTISTESSLDEAKALNAYVIGMLEQAYGGGSFAHCGGAEMKFACVAGSYALHDAANWIRAGEHGGKCALVVATDVAKYALGSSGEYTQGGGAVAMLVKEAPRLLALDAKVASAVVANHRDFFRPMGFVTPVFDGHYSNWAYILQIAKAFHAYKAKARAAGLVGEKDQTGVLEVVDHVVFHLPYPKMGKNAFAYLFREDKRATPEWQKIVASAGGEESPLSLAGADLDEMTSDRCLLDRDNHFRKALLKTEAFNESFTSKVADSLYGCSQLGNLYSAAIFMSFASLLERAAAREDLAGRRVLFCSYGSGSSAMVYSGVIQPGYAGVVREIGLESRLAARRGLDIPTYEKLHQGAVPCASFVSRKEEGFRLEQVGNEGVTTGYRYYALIGELAPAASQAPSPGRTKAAVTLP